MGNNIIVSSLLCTVDLKIKLIFGRHGNMYTVYTTHYVSSIKLLRIFYKHSRINKNLFGSIVYRSPFQNGQKKTFTHGFGVDVVCNIVVSSNNFNLAAKVKRSSNHDKWPP